MCRHAPRDKNTTVAVYECAAHRRRRRLRLLTVNDTVGTKKKPHHLVELMATSRRGLPATVERLGLG